MQSAEPVAVPAAALQLLDDPEEWPSFGRLHAAPQSSASPAQSVWESQVVLTGMYCATCALTIEDALKTVDGVLHAEVSGAACRARVTWDSTQVRPSQWMAAIAQAGYQAVPARDALLKEVRQAQHRKALWRWLLASFCMMQVMMYAWPAYNAQPGDLWMEYERLLRWASLVICIPMLMWACGPFFAGAWRDVRQLRISMDLPVALGMLITFAVSTWGTLNPEGVFGKEVFYDSLAMFVCFLLTGRWLEGRLRDRTAGALDAVMNRLPESVERCNSQGGFDRIAVRRLAVGDVIRILPGEAFAADGVIVRGRTQVDEALLTGESRALTRSEGESVVAGSYNLSSPVEVQVRQLGAQTKFAEIVALMERASTHKPQIAQLADKVAMPFLLVVLLLAVGCAVYWWPSDPGQALMIAAAVLIVTCPCALSLATPVAMLTAAGTLAKQGVLVRNLQGIEALAVVDTVVLDKTGTLTSDGISVVKVQGAGGELSQPHQGLAAAVALHSRHPVSRAVAHWGQAWAAHWQVLEVQELSGQGLRAKVAAVSALAEVDGTPQDFWVRLGSLAFAGSGMATQLGHAVYLAQETPQGVQCLGAMELAEGLRAEAAGTCAALRKAGLALHLLSGDSAVAVERVAQAVGIDQWHAQCMPEHKLQQMQAWQQAGHQVAMVGDGLNDGPVLAGADVSFAFGQAVPLAQAQSDLVILGNDLGAISQAVLLSRQTMRVVRQNLWGSACYNAISIPFAMLGLMPAWLAGLGMALSSLLVVLNAARLARPLEPLQCMAVGATQLRAEGVAADTMAASLRHASPSSTAAA